MVLCSCHCGFLGGTGDMKVWCYVHVVMVLLFAKCNVELPLYGQVTYCTVSYHMKSYIVLLYVAFFMLCDLGAMVMLLQCYGHASMVLWSC